jgi:hypothetical protein
MFLLSIFLNISKYGFYYSVFKLFIQAKELIFLSAGNTAAVSSQDDLIPRIFMGER